MSLQVSLATVNDLDHIMEFTRLLAEFDTVFAGFEPDRNRFQTAFFGPTPNAWSLLARDGDKVVGMATYYFTFSSFQAKRCIWLEDLFILEAYRKLGVGKLLMDRIMEIAKAHQCKHVEWLVETANQNGIGFYEHLGANVMEHLSYVRMEVDTEE